jgi:phage terminase small subunit
MALTPKKRMFAQEYLLDLNATQAAVRAGYSERTAKSQGQRLLTDVDIQNLIQGSMQRRSERVEVTAERVLSEIAKVAFSDVRKIFDDSGALIRISELDDDAAACIAGCEIVTVNRGEGEVDYIAKIKMADKLKALELAGKHLGLFRDGSTVEDTPMPTKIIVEVVNGRNHPELPTQSEAV